MQTQTTKTLDSCSFCRKNLKEGELHDCMIKAFNLLNLASQPQKNPDTIFDDIDNLVFQGGGVKGIAYLGVIEQLEKENPNLFKKLKRTAGSSAGSIVALYIALGLDYADIDKLMSMNYGDLLDNGLALKVAVNIEALFGSYQYKNFRVKDVLLTALDKIKVLQDLMEKDPHKAAETVTKMLTDMFKYYGCKFGTVFRQLWNIMVSVLSKQASKMLMEILVKKKEEPKKTTQQPQQNPAIYGFLRNFIEKEEIGTQSLQGSEENKKQVNFEELLHKCVSEAFCKYMEDEDSKQESMDEPIEEIHETRNYMKFEHEETFIPGGYNPPNGGVKLITKERLVSYSEDRRYNAPAPLRSMSSPKLNKNTSSTLSQSEEDALTKLQKETINYYLDQKKKPIIEIEKKSELARDDILSYALAELFWFIFVSQVGSTGFKEEIGMFTGDVFKQELIENAIKLRFEKLGRSKEYKEGLTFKELADFTDKNGNKLFKPFFVTAYNSTTLRTEVFSVYHCPNAVASDAVKASSSIPIFFTPTKIRENGVPRRAYYDEGKSWENIHYMDGGTLDNYPLWIFDDLKYCLDDIPEWIPDKKIVVQNPKTLGFRLMQTNMIDIYRNPYYDNQGKMQKRIASGKFQGTFGFIVKTIMASSLADVENEHIKRGDCPRSVYVDNMGVSAISFDLSAEDKKKLVDSGKNAVLDYKERASVNFFREGETYF